MMVVVVVVVVVVMVVGCDVVLETDNSSIDRVPLLSRLQAHQIHQGLLIQ